MTRILAALVVSTASIASADPHSEFTFESDWVKIGLTTGATLARDRGNAPTLGGVITAVHLDNATRWYGARGQVLADWNGSADVGPRWLVGVEAGKAWYGGILSYVGERVGGQTDHGVALHAKLTAGYVALYAGGIAVFTSNDPYGFDFGLELKLPVWTN